jgi:hypothetical protein
MNHPIPTVVTPVEITSPGKPFLSSWSSWSSWRRVRWLLCAGVVPALWACSARTLGDPTGQPSVVEQVRVLQDQTRKLDLLFMIDDSASMKPLQAKLALRLPDFMAVLAAVPGGLPDLHVAIISSSLGAGAYGDVPGCTPGPPGDDGGKFQHLAGCGLDPGANFLTASADGSTNNFSGPIETVFGCLALLGEGGCGFEHQFESTRQALIKAINQDADNGGFWRDDALLGVVMLTNEDDCSVPPDSQLFDPAVQSVNDQPPLGGLWSYRCNEFGHTCDQPLPHTAEGLPMTLTGCTSKENTDGLYHLTPEADFKAFFQQIKTPEREFLAIIAGPSAPYTVGVHTAQLDNGSTEPQPEIEHSCTAADGTYADPGIRETALVYDLGGIFLSICQDDFKPALQQIAENIAQKLEPQCIRGNVTMVGGAPDCNVVLHPLSTGTSSKDQTLPYCDGGTTSSTGTSPCWSLTADPDSCPGAELLRICYDATCGLPPLDTPTMNALVSCAE